MRPPLPRLPLIVGTALCVAAGCALSTSSRPHPELDARRSGLRTAALAPPDVTALVLSDDEVEVDPDAAEAIVSQLENAAPVELQRLGLTAAELPLSPAAAGTLHDEHRYLVDAAYFPGVAVEPEEAQLDEPFLASARRLLSMYPHIDVLLVVRVVSIDKTAGLLAADTIGDLLAGLAGSSTPSVYELEGGLEIAEELPPHAEMFASSDGTTILVASLVDRDGEVLWMDRMDEGRTFLALRTSTLLHEVLRGFPRR